MHLLGQYLLDSFNIYPRLFTINPLFLRGSYLKNTYNKGSYMMHLTILAIAISTLIIAGCKNSPLGHLTDKELSAKASGCRAGTDTSRTGVMICENVKKECAHRKSQGNKTC